MANEAVKSEQEQIKEENNSIRRLLQEMPNLKIAQNENALITSTIFIKELKTLVEEKVLQKREEVKSVASSMLGRNCQSVIEEYNIDRLDRDGVIKEYRKALGNIADIYAQAFKTILVLMLDVQAQELKLTIECKGLKQERNEIKRSTVYKIYIRKETMLKEQIKALIDQNLNEADKKLEELQIFTLENPLNELNENIKRKTSEIIEQQDKIRKCNEKLEEITQKAKEEIEKYSDVSQKALQIVSNEETFFQKIFAFMNLGKK